MGRASAPRMWRTGVTALLVGALSIGAMGGGAIAQEEGGLAKRAVEVAAERLGDGAGDLRVVATAEVDGGTVFKVVDGAGHGEEVVLDAAGVEQEDQGLRAEEAEDSRLHPSLVALLEADGLTGRGDTELPVLIWLDEPARTVERPKADARLTQAQAEKVRAQLEDGRGAEVGKLAAPMVKGLSRLGIKGRAVEQAPVVAATVSLGDLEAVADLPGVDMVYLDERNEPELDISVGVTDATGLHNAGITGSGVRVGVIEVGGRAATNPFLTVAVQDATSACATASAHTTAVAGIIRATPGTVFSFPFNIFTSTLRGMASGSELRVGGSCSGSSAELQARSTAAADWGARALNLSWGSDTALVPGANDRFYDDMSRNRAITVVKSAGNLACGGNGNVTSPGLGYNMITVGNVDTRRTAARGDDVMSGCSSFRNPTSTNGDRTKPEVSAPGTSIQTTTTAAPWTGNAGSGTSFAAPMVTGAAAMLMQRQPSLAFWPEQVKAILMTTALHNIEGATRLSDRDGAGMISASRADNVARGANGRTGGRFYSCANDPKVAELANVFVSAGTRVRSAISWSVDTSFAGYPNRPSADLDLWFEGPSSTTYSSSWDNNYEIVDFVAPTSGTYRLKVNKYRCDRDAFLGHAIHLGG